MDKSRVLTLIRETYETDEIGQRIPIESRRDVFCNLSSISASEWFAGGQSGLNLGSRSNIPVPASAWR